MQWLVNNHRQRIDAAYAINEGANGDLRNGRPVEHGGAGGGEGARHLHPYRDQPGRIFRAAPPGQRDLPAGQRAGAPSHYTFPAQLNDVTRAYFDAEGRGRRAPPWPRRCGPSCGTRATPPRSRSSRRVRTTTRCCARPAWPPELAAGHASNALAQTATGHGELPDAAGDDGGRGGAGPGPGAGRHGDPGERRAAPERGAEPGAGGDAGHDRAGDGAGVRRGRAGDPDDGRGRHRRGVPPRRGDPDLRDERVSSPTPTTCGSTARTSG